ncbi:glycoside hydrolase family 47 protein [Actinacidiphila glaucinigra]|uniref:Mannosyl-oligosaccharide alpha-1,2-mannosidase n=1 Tax=Actinacidiphila glaucinigra TaxID=235986 RepID=A0A239BX60_9ACTN|nr:glycoside hydrolase family 47 protein [Actinacidiphila glaucinigra]SNS11753.1 mannosyl-oligosaccharide alpha-1,2-mannosidase [Actinacidiphila glaucinigra]
MRKIARPRGLSRRGLLGAAARLAPLAAVPTVSLPGSAAAATDPYAALARASVTEFRSAWDAYRRLAWGRDELRPLTGAGSDFFIPGSTLGLTIVEALDTLYLMELDEELDAGVQWVRDDLVLGQDAPVQVFETIIRLVGGLLSGHLATKDTVLLDRARELADRLLPAFTRSPTGAPYRYVNLATGAVSGKENHLAEIGTCITEFGELSRLTGDRKYYDAAKKALHAVYERRSRLNLLGTGMNVETGAWTGTTATLDPPVDSFYEYLWDGWELYRDEDLRTWYSTLTAAVLEHLTERRSGRLWFRQADMRTGAATGHAQSELTAFYAGLLAQSGRVAEGEAYHASWAAALRSFRLPPESLDYHGMRALDPSYPLRPEYVDSCLFLWLTTGKELYRRRAAEMFRRQKQYCKVVNGYTVVRDVTARPMKLGDLTPAYWFSENAKYYYLLFARARRFDYRSNYLTTEGNVLRGLR